MFAASSITNLLQVICFFFLLLLHHFSTVLLHYILGMFTFIFHDTETLLSNCKVILDQFSNAFPHNLLKYCFFISGVVFCVSIINILEPLYILFSFIFNWFSCILFNLCYSGEIPQLHFHFSNSDFNCL